VSAPTPTPSPWAPEEIARLRYLVEIAGHTAREAGQKLGRSYHATKNAMIAHGVKSQHRGRPPKPGVSLTVRVPEAVAGALAAVAADAGTDPSAVAVGVLTDWAAGGAR
jgi:hypothetical protein